MKIIIVHPLNPSAEFTWSRIPFFLGNALKNLGIEIIPVTTGPSNFFEKNLLLLIQFVNKLDYTYSKVFRRLASIKLMSAINKNRPDAVLHFASTSAIPKSKLNIPQYLYIDNTWNLLITEASEYMTPKPSDYQILNIDKMENIFFHRFSKILSQTTRVSKDLHNHYGLSKEKIIQLGHGIGNIIPHLEEKDYSKKQIIFIARHSFKQKGGELMLEAVRIAQKKMPDIELIIEGNCEITGNIDDINNLSITGLSDIATLQKLLRDSTLLVMPALAEPFGIVYMEAMASKTPILALNRGAIPDFTDNGKLGFVSNKPDPFEIAELIIKAFSNNDQLKKVAEDGQIFVLENFCWVKIAENIKSLITNA